MSERRANRPAPVGLGERRHIDRSEADTHRRHVSYDTESGFDLPCKATSREIAPVIRALGVMGNGVG